MKKKAIKCISILTKRVFEIGSDPDCDRLYTKGYQDALQYAIRIISILWDLER